MNKKLNSRTNTLAVGKTVAGYRHSLLLGFLFVSIIVSAGCSIPRVLNDAIANAVEGEGSAKVNKAQTTKDLAYNCKVISITGLEPSGTMEESPRTKALYTSTSMSFTFDEKTGVLRGEGFDPLKMDVLQKGSNENSAIGYSTYKGRKSSGIAVLRIKKWEVGLPFLFLDSATLWTGSCETM